MNYVISSGPLFGNKKYGLFWEDNNSQSRNKTKSIITDIQISAHQLIENQPKDLSTSVSPIINMITNDTKAQKATVEHPVNTEHNEVVTKATIEHLVDTQNDEVIETTTVEHLVNTENNEVIEITTIEQLVNTDNDTEAENTTVENTTNTENNVETENTTVENIVATENDVNNEKSKNSMSVLESYQNIAKRYK